MMRIMMKYLMVNCKEATYLMGLREEGKLSLIGKCKLGMHTAMCSLCKRFEKQTRIIKKESPFIEAETNLPPASNEKLQKLVIDNMPS